MKAGPSRVRTEQPGSDRLRGSRSPSPVTDLADVFMLANSFDDDEQNSVENANSMEHIDFNIPLGPLSCYGTSYASPSAAWTNRIMKHMRIKTVPQHTSTIINKATDKHKGLIAEYSDSTSSKVLHAETFLNMCWVGKKDTSEPKPAPTDPLGYFSIIAVEVRETIFALAMEVKRCPIYMKDCGCVPSHLNWQPGHCSEHRAKYPVGTGRFNLLYASKQIRQEAMKIMYDRCILHIYVDDRITKYLCGTRSKTQDVPLMWNSIAQFRHITIEVPPTQISSGHPVRYTDRVLNIVILLTEYLARSDKPIDDPAQRSRTIDFGSMFHSLLPFNINHQVAHRAPEIFSWIAFQSRNPKEPEFGRVTLETEENLRRMTRLIGASPDRDCWKIFVNTDVAGASRPNHGGQKAFKQFSSYCKKHNIELVHSDRYDT